MEYFIRDFREPSTQEGPFTFTHADRKARKLSSENASGLMEMITFQQGVIQYVATYLRGDKRYQGLRSRQASLLNLPPTK